MGNRRSNGLDVRSKKSAKPTEIAPNTDRIRAVSTKGSERLNIATAAVQPAKISDHNNNDPSWADQTALIL